jgi:hypothetical protein
MRMRSSLLALLVLVLLAAGPALASKVEAEPQDPVAVVAELERIIQDPESSWQERWNAYDAAKKAIGDGKEGRQKEAEAAYVAIRPAVADALRRTNLAPSAWIMGFVGTLLLWGGFAFHLGIARRAGKQK